MTVKRNGAGGWSFVAALHVQFDDRGVDVMKRAGGGSFGGVAMTVRYFVKGTVACPHCLDLPPPPPLPPPLS
jgi:hypothetical protein